MNCPSCAFENTKVVDSRNTDNGNSIRRRRVCEKCEFRFTTFERIQLHNLMVQKKDGTVESYERAKVEKAILIACGKRKISLEKIREKLFEMEELWGRSKEITSNKIGMEVIEMLKELDEIAFIRFASVYKQFKDVETFKKELEKIF